MKMTSRRHKTTPNKGSHLPDRSLAREQGHDQLDDAIRDATRLHNEFSSAALSPCAYGKDVFRIIFEEDSLRQVLTQHFFTGYRSRDVYGGAHSFNDFLHHLMNGLLLRGKVFYAIDWEKTTVGDGSLWLPSFRYLPTATMSKVHLFPFGSYLQKYSLWEWIKYRRHSSYDVKLRTYFKKNEILYLKYPHTNSSPVRSCLRYLPQLADFFHSHLYRTTAMTYPEDVKFSIARARYQDSNVEMRKERLLKSKIARAFHVDEYNPLPITSYYDVYSVVKNRKFSNDFRQYLLEQFNKQVMLPLAKLNNLKAIPEVVSSGIMTNEEIDAWHKKYVSYDITLEQFIDAVIKEKKPTVAQPVTGGENAK